MPRECFSRTGGPLTAFAATGFPNKGAGEHVLWSSTRYRGSACEERLQVVYDKSTDLLVVHVLERPHDANLVPGLLAAAEDKREPEDVRRSATMFEEKILKKGVKLSDLR